MSSSDIRSKRSQLVAEGLSKFEFFMFRSFAGGDGANGVTLQRMDYRYHLAINDSEGLETPLRFRPRPYSTADHQRMTR